MLPGQLDLLTYAKERRDDGMQLASAAQSNHDPEWSELAYAAIVSLARVQQEIHVDHVLTAFHRRPLHPNAYGAVWMKAIRNRVIERTGQVRPCTVDPVKNAHQSPVYKSLIFDQQKGSTES